MQPRTPEIIQDAIIGSLITWPGERETVASILQASDFISGKHRAVYEWMLSSSTYDLVTLAHAMSSKVSAGELVEWMSVESTSAFLPRYCRELKEEANRVRLHDLSANIRAMFADGRPYLEIREHVESTLAQMTVGTKRKTMLSAADLASQAYTRVEKRYERKGELTGIPYGWPDLDNKTNGMHRGDLIIIAGRPSMGKTAFALNIFEAVTSNGYRGAFFSLEMGTDQVMDRMTASVGRVKYGNIRSGMLEQERDEWQRFQSACERMNRHTMMIDDTPSLSLADLKSRCRKLKAEEGLDLVVVDYLQLMKIPAKENRVQAIGEISRGLKLLARELDFAVIAISQLSRGVDSRIDKRPTMSDLRDSGELEQDADVILFPFRPAAYCDKCRDRKNDSDHDSTKHNMVAEIIIEKQRNGERNTSLPMVWLGQFQRFEQRKNFITGQRQETGK
ncbi:replicative DNA helicase [Geobacter sp. AOG1]|uniref:replicative DNA helicase n=1 Tax=Geobacter sp. AOG1 TaxID=1566346 RepID=UPI001CC57744|nr:replicative DNA helicase [Geobacter sp. AOG1]GFE56402.1 replicative DNA helicase [Geobacter sp. AOG1]